MRIKKEHFVTFKTGTTLQEEVNEEKKSFNKPITGDLNAQLVICHRSGPLGLTKQSFWVLVKYFKKRTPQVTRH